ncbi:MAG: hypothetical protein QOI28_1669 [Mycobacterium sp.]|jgi:hypothetical protein|nr:hypothetical protein [Mycobacterium sp.]MDT5292641.1 hypothetical protein [Mycobacterium sp.]MDT5362025.1 hypothetical protein [Mycobacterium sp.]
MRRSTTSAGTDRPFLGILLLVELIAAVALLARPAPMVAPNASPPLASNTPAPTSQTLTLRDGRTATLIPLGGARSAGLTARIAAELDSAAEAVTAFWGEGWRRDIVIVAASTDEEFATLGTPGSDIAAATTPARIVFAPGAAAMSDEALRIVLRHELFHYAARADTAADAPRWLTEGVADFVGRPPEARPGPARAADLARLPTDADLDTAGATRSLAYDRAWWFSRFVADRYGMPALRRLYLAACRPGHPDVATAVQDTLGADLPQVVASWRQWLSG